MSKFYKLPVEIASRRDISPGAKLVFAVIRDRIGKNDFGFPGTRSLSRDTGLSRTTVIEGIQQLEEQGLLDVERRGNGKANHYRLSANTGQETAPVAETGSGPETVPVKKVDRSRNCTIGGQETEPEGVQEPTKTSQTHLTNPISSCRKSDVFRLCKLLLNLILERKPDFKKPDLKKWAIHINRAIRLDGRTPERTEDVIRWCQQDDFWQNNILSTEKLRKHFDKLELKMEKGNGKVRTESQTFDNLESQYGTTIAV